MRLIDADALYEDISILPATMSVCLTRDECDGRMSMKESALREVKEAPTVDAIPMWWITEKFLDVLNKDKELSKAVWLVRNAWQKEQEAHGT